MLRRALGLGLVALLMVANAVALMLDGARRRPRLDVVTAWRLPFAQAQGAVLTRLAPGERPVIVAQTPREVALVTPQGKLARSVALGDVVTLASGDLNGDGGDEIVLLRSRPSRVQARGAELQPLWSLDLESAVPAPTRVAVIDLDGDGAGEVVAGGPAGLRAWSAAGRELWTFSFESQVAGEQGELRGLDDLRLPDGTRRVAAARRNGDIVVLDAEGKPVHTRTGQEIRRLRAGDVDGDRRGELLIGYDSGTFSALDETGRTRLTAALDEAVVEVRRLELDGQPDTPEVALGGRRGQVLVVARGGRVLLAERLGARVTDLAGVDVDGDGRDELVAGTEDNSVSVFSLDGGLLASLRVGGKPERIVAAGSPRGPREILVAGGAALEAFRLDATTPPLWFSPLVAALLGLGGLGAFAVALHFLRPPVKPAPAPPDIAAVPVLDALQRLDALVASGHVSPEQAEERRVQLEQALASATLAPAAETPPAPAPPPQVSPPPPPRRR